MSKNRMGKKSTLRLRERGCQGGDESYEFRFDVFTFMLQMKTC